MRQDELTVIDEGPGTENGLSEVMLMADMDGRRVIDVIQVQRPGHAINPLFIHLLQEENIQVLQFGCRLEEMNSGIDMSRILNVPGDDLEALIILRCRLCVSARIARAIHKKIIRRCGTSSQNEGGQKQPQKNRNTGEVGDTHGGTPCGGETMKSPADEPSGFSLHDIRS